jgi:plasmid stability protein
MGQLLVRNVDDATIAWLKARALANGRSVEAEHREVLRAASSAGAPTDFWARAAKIRADLAGRSIAPTEELLREARADLK